MLGYLVNPNSLIMLSLLKLNKPILECQDGWKKVLIFIGGALIVDEFSLISLSSVVLPTLFFGYLVVSKRVLYMPKFWQEALSLNCAFAWSCGALVPMKMASDLGFLVFFFDFLRPVGTAIEDAPGFWSEE